MKKALYILAGLLGLLLLTMIVVPIIFKDDIRKAVDQELENAVNAKIYYNPDQFGLSFFKQFPNLTLSLGEFGVAGVGAFEGDTLVDVRSFDLTINLASLMSDQITIKAITLDRPSIELLVLADGKANWDIAKADSSSTEDTTSAPSSFSLKVQKWEIKDASIVYSDLQGKMLAQIENLNHTGSGDLTATVYDVKTYTLIKGLSYEMDEARYLNKAELEADLTMNIDMEKSSYTFKDNKIRLNDFSMGFEGNFAMPADGSMQMDLKFGAKETAFKNILSLVPGMFLEGFEKMKTSGSLAFDGWAKGTYKDSTQMPGFLVNLKVIDGMFQYPDLPAPVSNIQIDVSAGTENGDLQKLTVDLRKGHLDLGSNPVDITLNSEGLMPVTVNGKVNAKVNLAEALKVFPVEGLEMKGNLSLQAEAHGTYSETSMPALTAALSLSNGYVKSAEFPAPLEDLRMIARAGNPSGQNADFKATVEDFGMKLEGETITAKLNFENLDDYTWDLMLKGAADLEKMTKIFPLEGMSLKGKVVADIQTSGKMSDLDAGKYEKLPTSGNLSATGFEFISADLPQGLGITKASMVFNPREISLTDFQGRVGKSDLTLSGSLSNYLGFALHENEVLKGNLNFYSRKFDVNEWMVEDSSASDATTEDTLPMTVVEIPKTIDFVLQARIDQVLYSNMDISNLNGKIIVKDGSLRLENNRCNALGGSLAMNGLYDTRNIEKPAYDFDLKMEQVAIAKLYESFSTVKALAPIAKGMQGNISTDFKIKGDLDSHMMPVMSTLSGGGLLNVKQAAIKDVKLLNNLADATKMNNLREVSLADVFMMAEIRDGRVHLKPFDLKAGSTTARISGSSGLDQTLDFDILLPGVATGAAGQALNTALSGFLGGQKLVSDKVDITLKALGPFSNPKVSIASIKPVGGGGANQAVNDQINKAKAEAEARIREEQEKLKREAEERVRQEQERLKREAEERLKREAENARKKLKDKFGIPK